MQRPSGKIELVSKSRSRNLSSVDHSCTDSRRKTTTTPAKPASATATCAAVLSTSPGCIVTSFQTARGRACLFSACGSSYATELLCLCATGYSQQQGYSETGRRRDGGSRENGYEDRGGILDDGRLRRCCGVRGAQ